MKAALEDPKRCCTQGEKEAAWKKAGLSGKSILWRLSDLYGFDVSLDCVYDVMHILSLNLFKKYILHLLQKSDASQKKEIDAAVRSLTKVVPSSTRYGRWPNTPSVYSDSFKAEENQKFIQWCFPYISKTVSGISPEMHNLGYLLIDLAHSFHNYYRDHGWSIDDIRVAKLLLQSWKEEDIYLRCIKSLAARRKYSKRKTDQSTTSSSVCMIDNAQNHNDLSKLIDTDAVMVSSKDKEEEASTHIDNAQNDNDLSKLIDTDAVMVSSKDKEEKASTYQDVEVYIPKILWQNNGDTNDAYEVYLQEHPREPREESVNNKSPSLERKARDLCLGDKEDILMKWLGTKKVKEIYNLVKPSYITLKKTHSFFKRKGSETFLYHV
ncbi:hypothetical protein L7F22_006209 [Adiantum nelumboides]|nr:hypothetical protein [Adiantum nelumboides]